MRPGLLIAIPILAGCDLVFELRGPPSDGGGDGAPVAPDPSLILHLTFDDRDNLLSDVNQHVVTCPSGCPVPALDRHDEMAAARFDEAQAQCLEIIVTERPATFTFAVWARIRNQNGDAQLFSRPRDADTTGGNTFEGYVTGNAEWVVAVQNVPLTSSAQQRDVWHHLAGRFDGQTFALFLDGAMKSSMNLDMVSYANDPLLVGCENNSGLESFATGEIDDVRLYGRALAIPEIATLAAP